MNQIQGTKLEHTTHPAALSRQNPERSLELALAAARVAAENRGTDVAVLDMTESAAWVDYFVIATGTSRRQLHAMSELIDDKLEKDLGDKRMNIDGYDESKWPLRTFSHKRHTANSRCFTVAHRQTLNIKITSPK